jgi:magnesium-transporting ATPase (P-type)
MTKRDGSYIEDPRSLRARQQAVSRALILFALSTAGSFACAILFIVAMGWGLLKSDSAYGQSLGRTFTDPFVKSVLSFIAIGSALLVFPLAYLCLRERRLSTAFPFVLTSVLAEIAIVTPVFAPVGFFGAYFVLIMSLRFVKDSKWKLFRPRAAH